MFNALRSFDARCHSFILAVNRSVASVAAWDGQVIIRNDDWRPLGVPTVALSDANEI